MNHKKEGTEYTIEELCKFDQDALLANLYTDITGQRFGGDTFIAEGVYWSLSQRLVAVLWLSDNFDTLFQSICVKWQYCNKREDSNFSDSIALSTAICDIVSAVIVGVPPFTVSVLLVKLGLDKFCNCSKGEYSREFIDTLKATWISKASGKPVGHKYYSDKRFPSYWLGIKYAFKAISFSKASGKRKVDEYYYDEGFYRAWYWLGIKYLKTGKVKEGCAKFEKSIKMGGRIAKKDATLWNNYAYYLTEAGQPNEAIKLARKAVKLNRKSSASWDSLGWSLLKAGKSKNSIKPFKKALKIDRAAFSSQGYGVNGRLEIRYHIVTAFKLVGLEKTILPILEEMTKIDSENEWTKRARQEFAKEE